MFADDFLSRIHIQHADYVRTLSPKAKSPPLSVRFLSIAGLMLCGASLTGSTQANEHTQRLMRAIGGTISRRGELEESALIDTRPLAGPDPQRPTSAHPHDAVQLASAGW